MTTTRALHHLPVTFLLLFSATICVPQIGHVQGGGGPAHASMSSASIHPFSGIHAIVDPNGAIFADNVIYHTGGDLTSSVVVADVNGDGKPDLIVESPNLVSVLLGNGDGTFQAAVTYAPGAGPSSVAVADLNKDGKPDLVVTYFEACGTPGCSNEFGVGVLLGNGDGTFQKIVNYASGWFTGDVVLADVNGDGNLDVVANVSCNSCTPGEGLVGVLLGNGNGTFQAPVTYSSDGSGGTGVGSVAVADVNGDGKPDLLVGNFLTHSVGVLLGNGDGTFQAALKYRTGEAKYAVSIAVADLNGDGKPDLVVSDGCFTDSCLGGAVSVLLGLPAKTATKIATSVNPSLVGEPVTFTATISSADGAIPDGKTVTFYASGIEIGTSATVSGVATVTTSSLKKGTHTIKASFPASGYFKASVGTVKQTVDN